MRRRRVGYRATGAPDANQADVEGLATATQKLADEIAAAARELADNPQADVDERLQDAEGQANALSEQAQDSLDEQQPELSSALQDANQRLARAAVDLRDTDSVDDVRSVLERDLGPAGARPSDAAAEAQKLAGPDTQLQLEQAHQIEQLRDQMSGLGG